MSGIKLHYLNTSDMMKHSSHGTHAKDMAVLHETVSPDLPGLSDITQVESYLAEIGYGIHGMTDLEGHMAWAYGHGNDIFYHAGGVNSRAIGIEQVSYIPMLLQKKQLTVAQAASHWKARTNQLHATAKVLAAWHNVSPSTHVLKRSDGTKPGVTSHWEVSQHFPESEGHTDCWPVDRGGYFPLIEVIDLAKSFAKLGYHF